MQQEEPKKIENKTQLKMADVNLNFLPKRVRSFISSHGDEEITSMFIARSVIDKNVESFLNTISFGLLNKIKKKLNYDKLFHLKLIINGKYTYEKNQTVNIGGPYVKGKDEQQLPIDVPSGLTIVDFMNKGMKRMKDSFFKYDAFNQNGGTNCQIFVLNNLIANGLAAPRIVRFVKQDIKTIAEGLPSFVKDAARTITNITQIGDYIRQELGLKHGGVVHQPYIFVDMGDKTHFTL